MKTAGFELVGTATPVRQLLRGLVDSRDLIGMLARKDFYVRYRRASLGLLWALGLPLAQAAVLSVVFTQVVRIEVGIAYVAFVLAGILPWSFFSGALNGGSTAIVDGSQLASKIYFPRAVLPLTVVIAGLYTFAPSVLVLFGTMVAFDVPFHPEILMLIPATLLMALLTAGFLLVTSALHVYFRDMRFVVQAALTAWFYATPVIYPLDRAPSSVRPYLEANPLTGIVQLFRSAVLGFDGVELFPSLWVAAGVTVALLAIGIALQSRYDRVFIDLL